MTIIQGLGWPKQEDFLAFEASMAYITRLRLYKPERENMGKE